MDFPSTKHKRMYDVLLGHCNRNLPKVNAELLKKGFLLSLEAHKNDFRSSGEPYFNHPFEVALILTKEITLDDVSVIAALLHDVVEDTDFSLEFIHKEFGKEIAEIVDGVTKISGIFKGQEISQAENYRKLLLSMVKDVRVILVKFADRLHNMRTLEFLKPEKQIRIAKETMDIYAPFANRFGLGKVKWELEDLAFKYMNKEAYIDIAKKVKNKRREREAYLTKFNKPIIEKLNELEIEYSLGGRPKHLYSVYRKMIKQNSGFEEIYDLLAVRIVLESEDTNKCYYVLGVINQLYLPLSERFKDYIAIPKKNNYQSIHTTVVGPEGKIVEIQIRTRMMHEIAEKGVAAHWRYKENISQNNKDLEDWVNWVRDIFENINKEDASEEIIESFKLNLYQNEIYVFSPKGDLKRLPKDSTPVDFAYEVHSRVGYHCIGAKLNGKIVPLDTLLHSGDQIEIITSKNQHPNKGWLRFVKTHKAKSDINKFLNREDDIRAEEGKDIWEKKIKKLKLHYFPDDVLKLARKYKFDNAKQFFKAIVDGKADLDEILNPTREEKKVENIFDYEKFVDVARGNVNDILVGGELKGIEHAFAKCCNPIPGDPITGFVTIGEGVKIHRKNCKNIINMAQTSEVKLLDVDWPKTGGSMFLAGISIRGHDKPGLLQEISNIITGYKNTNIKSANINVHENIFNGTITIFVEDLDHLNKLIERLKKIGGIHSVVRFNHTS